MKMRGLIIVLTLVILLQCKTTFSYGYDSDDSEIEVLTEQLFDECEPNIFPYVRVNLQSSTSSWSRSDDADLPLLSVDEAIVYKVPTISKLRALFDNYEVDASLSEDETSEERNEQKEFINSVLDTQVMKSAMKFLHRKGLVDGDRENHFNLLKKIWFNMYPRTHGNVGSSGFEHVFLNEMKYGSPIGLHNWIYFHHKENKTHTLDYKGYMRNLQLGDKAQVLKYRMSYEGVTKPVNSMFIGTLPELDMALFTVCFQMDQQRCHVSLDGQKFTIRAFPFYYQGDRLVGAAYPVI